GGEVIALRCAAPGASCNPCDLVPPKYVWTINQRAEQHCFAARPLRLGCAGSKCRRAELDEPRQRWGRAKTKALGCQRHREGLGISKRAGHLVPSFGSRVSRRAP